MNMSKILILVWLFLIITICNSLALSQSEKSTFKLEEVQSNIDNPIAVIPVTKMEGDESLVQNIVKTDDQLLFVDENYNTIHTRQIQPGRKSHLTLSKQCRYLLLHEVFIYPEKGIDGKATITFLDYTGKEYWSKEIPLIWDSRGYTNRFISDDNGNVIEFVCKVVLLVRVINPSGEVKNSTKLFDDIDKWDESESYFDITTSGKYFAILINKYYPIPEKTVRRVPLRGPDKGKELITQLKFQSGEPHLFLFNSDGDLLNTRKCENEKVGNLVITDADFILIIVSTSNLDRKMNPKERIKTVVFDLNLDSLYTLPNIPYKYCIINGSIVIGHKNRISQEPLLSAFDNSNGEKQWSVPIECDPVFMYADDDIDIIHVISVTIPKLGDPIERFSLRSYNSKGKKISDDFLDMEMKYTGISHNSKLILWEKSSYVINNKIYIKRKQIKR